MPIGQGYARLSHFNGSAQNPLSEDGVWARLDTDGSGALEKVTGGVGGKSYIRSSVTSEVRDAYYTSMEFGPNVEVAVQAWQFPNNSIIDLYIAAQDAGTGGPDYYRLRVQKAASGSGATWTISHISNDVVTQLATTSWSFFSGDWIYFRRFGNNLEAREFWYDDFYDPTEDTPDPESMIDDSQIVLTATDSTITTDGYVGFGANDLPQVRNFFGGTYISENMDAETVYLTLTPKTTREGIVGGLVVHSFDHLDFWEFEPGQEDQDKHFTISPKWAIEGDNALRVDHATTLYYPSSDYTMRWVAIDGDPDEDIYLAYAFRIDKWADIYRGGDEGPSGGWGPGQVLMPSFAVNVDGAFDWDTAQFTLRGLSETTGEIRVFRLGEFATETMSLTEGTWHTLRCRYNFNAGIHQVWVDGTLVVDDVTDLTVYTHHPEGILFRGDNSGYSGVVRYDDMRWRVGTDCGTPPTTELKDGTSPLQWIKIRERANSGGTPYVYQEWDPDFLLDREVIYTYTQLYIPRDLLESLASNDATRIFYEVNGEPYNALNLWIRRNHLNQWFWEAQCGAGGLSETLEEIDIDTGTDQWYVVKVFYDATGPTYEVTINGNLYSIDTASNPPTAVTAHSVSAPMFYGTPNTPDYVSWIGTDNLAYNYTADVTEDNFIDWWKFDTADPIAEAIADYPGPPARDGSYGEDGWILSLEESSYGPGPELPIGTVYLTLTVSASEVVSLTTVGDVYLDLQAQSGAAYFEAATVYLDLIVLGGECHSTWSGQNVGDGDAFPRWVGRAYQVWTGDANTRWSPGEVIESETIHC